MLIYKGGKFEYASVCLKMLMVMRLDQAMDLWHDLVLAPVAARKIPQMVIFSLSQFQVTIRAG